MTLATAVLILAALWVGHQLEGTRPSAEHLDVCAASNDGLDDPGCADVRDWLSLRETELGRLIGALPFVVGIVLGSVLVSREIEHRSAQLVWSLRGSRRRWFLERALPVGGLLLAALVVLAVSTDYLEAMRQPGVDPSQSLHEYGQRGPSLVARGIAVFAVATFVGTLFGRQLPALIVSGLIAVMIGYGLAYAFPYGASWRWIPADRAVSLGAEVSMRFARSGFLADDGTIYTYDEARRQVPDGLTSGEVDDWVYAHFVAVNQVLEGTELPEIEGRESAMLGVLALASLGACLIAVDRRRPY